MNFFYLKDYWTYNKIININFISFVDWEVNYNLDFFERKKMQIIKKKKNNTFDASLPMSNVDIPIFQNS